MGFMKLKAHHFNSKMNLIILKNHDLILSSNRLFADQITEVKQSTAEINQTESFQANRNLMEQYRVNAFI
jgi:hypothetical protein